MNAIANLQISEPPATAGVGEIVGAKSVFQLCIADPSWRLRDSQRLTRRQFESFFLNRAVSLVVMEACGSAHHWARWLNRLGIEVLMLPAAYVRAYVRRNKTDAADAAALLQAARDSDIKPVRTKTVEQQALQGLHRARSLWKGNRTQRINTLRGFCREFGIAIAQGSRLGVEQIARVLAEPHSAVPELLRPTANLLVEEIRLMEARVAQLEREPAVPPKRQQVMPDASCTVGPVAADKALTHLAAQHFVLKTSLTARPAQPRIEPLLETPSVSHIIDTGHAPRCFAMKPNLTSTPSRSRPLLFSAGRAPS